MSATSELDFDLLIAGGRIVDGSGQPGYGGDLGIRDGLIAAIGQLDEARARRRIDARGLIVAPGFIDIHTHSDIALLSDPADEARLYQGVTTVVFSNCGLGFAPATKESLGVLKKAYRGIFGDWELEAPWQRVSEYLDRFRGRTSTNVVYLVPHAALRVAMTGMTARAATEREVSRMAELMMQGMEDGACGLSTGLYYAPMCFASRGELLALLAVVKEGGGFFAIHMRDYFAGLVDSLAEALDLAETAGVPVQISHLQAAGKGNWGKAGLLLEMIAEARRRGVEVTIDSYPYLAGSTFLHSLLPAWAQMDGPEGVLRRLTDLNERRRILDEMKQAAIDWSSLVLSGLATSANQGLIGRPFDEVSRERGVAEPEAVCQLLIEEELDVSFIYHHGHEDDMCRIMRSPIHTIGSDGIQAGQRPHPRLYGAFARYLGRYVRNEKLLPLEEGIRKITSLPAARLGLKDRGRLAEGMAADINIIELQSVGDLATYESPTHFASGVEYVIVNGEIVKDRSGATRKGAGKLLSGQSSNL